MIKMRGRHRKGISTKLICQTPVMMWRIPGCTALIAQSPLTSYTDALNCLLSSPVWSKLVHLLYHRLITAACHQDPHVILVEYANTSCTYTKSPEIFATIPEFPLLNSKTTRLFKIKLCDLILQPLLSKTIMVICLICCLQNWSQT
jgi:hypothetical protein